MAITANSLQGFLAVYAQKSLEQFIADMPPREMFTENFDESISNGGVSVTTRIPTTIWGTLNDLGLNGWAKSRASASPVTATLATKDYDIQFNETEWATITPTMLQNTYFPPMIKQLANGIIVDGINLVTSSVFTSAISGSTGAFGVSGSFSLGAASKQLNTNEVPESSRYAIVNPSLYLSLVNSVLPTYVYGSPAVVQGNGYGPNGKPAMKLMDFDSITMYPRFYDAALPQGGAAVTGSVNGDKLVGIAGNKQGLVLAVRSPVDVNNGLVQSATAVDPTSRLSLQVRVVYDVSVPCWRLAAVALYGVAAGNPKAIVPLLST
jgi:hypothetical protein